MLRRLREEVASAARALAAAGLVSGTQGNVSARADDVVAVTGTGISLGTASEREISVVDLDGRLLDGPEPSSELRVHLGIYGAFPQSRAVVHGHVLPPNGRAPVAPFAPEGSQELADAVVAAMRDGASLVVMERHGTVARGPSLAEALDLAASSGAA